MSALDVPRSGTIGANAMPYADAGDSSYRLVRGSGQILLVVFAHRDAEDFAFQAVTDHLRCPKLFLRDVTLRGWYNAGLGEAGADLSAISAFIRDKARDVGTARLCMLGSSMGGYAALLFGSLCKAERVLTFNPQTLLDPVFPLSPPENLAVVVPDLRPLLAGHPDMACDIVIGQDDAVDVFHAGRVCDLPNIRLWTSHGTSHLITDELSRRGDLRSLLSRWISGAQPTNLVPISELKNPILRDAVVAGVWFFMRGEFQAAIGGLQLAAMVFNAHPGLLHFLGMTASHLGQDDIAEAALRTTLVHRPGWHHTAALLKALINKPTRTKMNDDVIEGLGDSVDAATLDALRAAAQPDAVTETRIEIVSWGAQEAGSGGARRFWVKVRRV